MRQLNSFPMIEARLAHNVYEAFTSTHAEQPITCCSHNYKKSERYKREKKTSLLPSLGPLKDFDKSQVIVLLAECAVASLSNYS